MASLCFGVLQGLLVLIGVKAISIRAGYITVYLRGFKSLVISLLFPI